MRTTEHTSRNESANFTRFCAVGAFGFFVDAGILQMMVYLLDWDPFSARIVSILIAVTATWALHRYFTFRSSDPGLLMEWSRFFVVNVIGAALNFAVYSAVLFNVPSTRPMFALTVGSTAALAANYFGSSFFAFAKPDRRV